MGSSLESKIAADILSSGTTIPQMPPVIDCIPEVKAVRQKMLKQGIDLPSSPMADHATMRFLAFKLSPGKVCPRVPTTLPPNVTLMQPTDPPYCCCSEQEWGETVQAPLLVGNSQDPSTVEDTPTRHDKLLNPATKLPDPAPNLADIASQFLVHGESFKTPWPKQQYFEVPPPAPNIHVKTCKTSNLPTMGRHQHQHHQYCFIGDLYVTH
jgi:hypothetical protein